TLLLLDLQVVDDAAHALDVVGEPLGTRLLLGRIDVTGEVDGSVGDVDVDLGEVRHLLGDELGLHRGQDGLVIDVLTDRLTGGRPAADGEDRQEYEKYRETLPVRTRHGRSLRRNSSVDMER